MWLANALTLVRVPLALVFVLTYREPGWPWLVLAVAALSDVLDGWAARRARAGRPPSPPERSVGAWLDPAADKVFVLAVLATIVVHERPPLWLAAMIATRELVLIPIALGYRVALWWRPQWSHDLRADRVGKVTTGAQFVALALLALRSPWAVAAAPVAGVLGLVASARYVARGLRARRGSAVPA